MSTIKRLVKARALRQGLLGGHPFWRVVWLGQFAYKQFAKVSKGGEAPISFDEPLKEGEAWAVVHEPEKTKRGLGLGRKFLIGPQRKKSRVNTLTGLALGVAGEKILAAPSPERINEILGEKVFDPTPLTKAQKRAAKQTAKLEAAQAADDAKHAASLARAQRAQDKADAKAANKADAKAKKLTAKAAVVAAKAARGKAAKDAKLANTTARTAARETKKESRANARRDSNRAKSTPRATENTAGTTPTVSTDND